MSHEITAKIGAKIMYMSFGEGNTLMLMMQDLMYFDTVPDEYKKIINEVFGCEFGEDEDIA